MAAASCRGASARFPSSQIVAFDPADDLYRQARRRLDGCTNVLVTNALDMLPGTFDRVACLEVLEHLPPVELEAALLDVRVALAKDGLCLFTFPIEHGAMSLAKNVYRITTGGDPYPSLASTARAFFGLSVPRQPSESLSNCSYIYSHLGFDCRAHVGDNLRGVRDRGCARPPLGDGDAGNGQRPGRGGSPPSRLGCVCR